MTCRLYQHVRASTRDVPPLRRAASMHLLRLTTRVPGSPPLPRGRPRVAPVTVARVLTQTKRKGALLPRCGGVESDAGDCGGILEKLVGTPHQTPCHTAATPLRFASCTHGLSARVRTVLPQPASTMSRVAHAGTAMAALAAAVLLLACTTLPRADAADAAPASLGWPYSGGSMTQQSFFGSKISRVGSIEWQFAAGTSVPAGVVTNGDGSRVYVVTQDQRVSCWSVPPSALGGLELAIGLAKPKLEWSFTIGSGVTTSPALSEDETMLFVGCVHVGVGYAHPQLVCAQHDHDVRPPHLVDTRAESSHVYALHTATGTEAWPAFQAGGPVSSALVAAGGVLYFGTSTSQFYALEAATGKQSWACATTGAITG